MEPIIVRRHGTRWAIVDEAGSSPIAEYDTRELAEVAARERADGSGREVRFDEDTGDAELGQVTEPDVEEAPTGGRRPVQPPRDEQAGL